MARGRGGPHRSGHRRPRDVRGRGPLGWVQPLGGLPFFIVTHRPEEQPPGDAFTFVGSFEQALDQARAAAGDKDVHVMGGAEIIRQALAGGHVEQLSIIVPPVVLGGGKRLFEGFTQPLELEQAGVRRSPLATFIDYRVTG